MYWSEMLSRKANKRSLALLYSSMKQGDGELRQNSPNSGRIQSNYAIASRELFYSSREPHSINGSNQWGFLPLDWPFALRKHNKTKPFWVEASTRRTNNYY